MGTPPRAAADEPVYVISVAARLVELPGWVLRVLDQEGVVVPSRTESNRRLYSDNDIALLNRVRHLTEELGVNIAGVKVILEMERAQGTTEESTTSAAAPLPPQTSLVPHASAHMPSAIESNDMSASPNPSKRSQPV